MKENKGQETKKYNLNKENYINEFDSYARAKKQHVIITISFIASSVIIIIAVLFWAANVSKNALNKVIVVERSGEYLKTSTDKNEKLFQTLIRTTCSNLAFYANSFDRFTIRENQAKALFYGEKLSLETIFIKYKDDGSYHEALENGAIYDCRIEKFGEIKGIEPPYFVDFTCVLEVKYLDHTTRFRIYCVGELEKCTPQFPENTTGFFFRKYQQTFKRIDEVQEAEELKKQNREEQENI